ncbi:MAG: hypothetical protein R3F56_24345 [Planctomycetota bacterium]
MAMAMWLQGAQGTWEETFLDGAIRWVGPMVLAGLSVWVVVRAVWRRRRYLAERALTAAEREAVHAAVRAAERCTVGEVVPVVFERSDAHPVARWRAAAAGVALGSACLVSWLPWYAPIWLLACQLGFGVAAGLLAHVLRDLARTFVSEARATEVAEEQAYQEFFRLRLHETQGRTGVLLFVSLFERRVVVLADRGIDDRVEGAQPWQAAKDAVLVGIARDRLTDGLVAAIEEVGRVLAQHAPWTEGDRNELPDRLIVQSDNPLAK